MSKYRPRPAWLLFLSLRWKAVAALVGSLATALLVVYPGSHAIQLIIAVIGALVTTGAVHQVTNVGSAPVQEVVDAVVAAVPPVAAVQVAQAVANTTTGVLATAVGSVTDTVATAVGDLTGTGLEGG